MKHDIEGSSGTDWLPVMTFRPCLANLGGLLRRARAAKHGGAKQPLRPRGRSPRGQHGEQDAVPGCGYGLSLDLDSATLYTSTTLHETASKLQTLTPSAFRSKTCWKVYTASWYGARVMTPSEFSTPLTMSGRVLSPVVARAASGAHTRISGGAKHIVI